MAYSFGGGVNAQLGAVDYSPFLRGSLQGSQMAAQGAAMQGQAIGQLGQMVGQGIQQAVQNYQIKQEKKQMEEGAVAALRTQITQNPELGRLLGIADVKDDKVLKAAVKSVGPEAILSLNQQIEQQKAAGAAMRAPAAWQPGQGMLKSFGEQAPPSAAEFMQRALQGGVSPNTVAGLANAMTNAQRQPAPTALPPMALPREQLQNRYPSDKWNYDIVGERDGAVLVKNISPRAPAAPIQEIPNPILQDIYKDLSSNRATAEAAVKSAAAYDRILGIMEDPEGAGVVAGVLAKPELFLRKVGSALGLKSDQVVNTEMIQSMIAIPTAQMIQNFGAGTGLSDADREFALKAAAGDFRMEPESLVRLARINRDVAMEARGIFNKRVQDAFPEDTAIDKRARSALFLPETPASKAKPSKAQSILDKYGIK